MIHGTKEATLEILNSLVQILEYYFPVYLQLLSSSKAN